MSAFKLSCPYCDKTPLQEGRSRFRFQRGCRDCDYRFEREAGYFSGASQIVSFTILALSALVFAWLLKSLFTSLTDTAIVVLTALVLGIQTLILTPYCMALWLWMDHRLHPLGERDIYDKEIDD